MESGPCLAFPPDAASPCMHKKPSLVPTKGSRRPTPLPPSSPPRQSTPDSTLHPLLPLTQGALWPEGPGGGTQPPLCSPLPPPYPGHSLARWTRGWYAAPSCSLGATPASARARSCYRWEGERWGGGRGGEGERQGGGHRQGQTHVTGGGREGEGGGCTLMLQVGEGRGRWGVWAWGGAERQMGQRL